MEPITTTMIATLILSKAAEEGGKKLGEAVSNKLGQLFNLIGEKFKAEGVEGKLVKVQEDPSEKNRLRFEQELEGQMEDDSEFADKLKALVEELQSDAQIKQVFFKGVKVQQDAKLGKLKQDARGSGSIEQQAVTDIEVGGSLTIGDIEQSADASKKPSPNKDVSKEANRRTLL